MDFLKKFEHGGDVYSRKIRLDFSANINPLGIPAGVRKALIESAENCDRYPDPECRGLIRAIAEAEKVCEDQIACGNGAADLIYRIAAALRPKKALVCAPTFSEYEKALSEYGCIVEKHYLSAENGFALTDDIIEKIGKADIAFLGNPNNPDGKTIPCELTEKICGTGSVIVYDECFIGFTGNENISAKRFMNERTIILKAFTKLYAVPGIRLGYAVFGDKELCGKVRATGQCWSVSVPAQAAGTAALGEKKYVHETVETIKIEREYLTNELRALGFEVFASEANFILFRTDCNILQPLSERGIAVRNCENYDGLGTGYYRIAVRLRDENTELIKALTEVLYG